MAALVLTVSACDRPREAPKANSTYVGSDVDNTGRNVRDRDFKTVTPENQSENDADRSITKNIRKVIVADDALSQDAKNIKIITIDGVVTLRGPVNSSQEKNIIARKANAINGVKRVENQLEVKMTP